MMDAEKKRITAATAAQIKQLRRSRGFSQEELALRSGINAVYFGQLERGLKCPTIDTLYKIAKGLDVTLPELLCWDAAPPDPQTSRDCIERFISSIPPGKSNQVLKLLETISGLLE